MATALENTLKANRITSVTPPFSANPRYGENRLHLPDLTVVDHDALAKQLLCYYLARKAQGKSVVDNLSITMIDRTEADNPKVVQITLGGVTEATKKALDDAVRPLTGQPATNIFADGNVKNELSRLYPNITTTVSQFNHPLPAVSADLYETISHIKPGAPAPTVTNPYGQPRPTSPADMETLLTQTVLHFHQTKRDLDPIPSVPDRADKIAKWRKQHSYKNTVGAMAEISPNDWNAPKSYLGGRWSGIKAFAERFEEALRQYTDRYYTQGHALQNTVNKGKHEAHLGAIEFHPFKAICRIGEKDTEEQQKLAAKIFALALIASLIKNPQDIAKLDPNGTPQKLVPEITAPKIKPLSDDPVSKKFAGYVEDVLKQYCKDLTPKVAPGSSIERVEPGSSIERVAAPAPGPGGAPHT